MTNFVAAMILSYMAEDQLRKQRAKQARIRLIKFCTASFLFGVIAGALLKDFL